MVFSYIYYGIAWWVGNVTLSDNFMLSIVDVVDFSLHSTGQLCGQLLGMLGGIYLESHLEMELNALGHKWTASRYTLTASH